MSGRPGRDLVEACPLALSPRPDHRLAQDQVHKATRVRHRRLASLGRLGPGGSSLLVGFYNSGKLIYAGSVRTGFGDRLGREIVAKLDDHRRGTSPFVDTPRAEARGAHWVEPVYVADVEFTAWTRDGHIRHPSFKGMRLDKTARWATGLATAL